MDDPFYSKQEPRIRIFYFFFALLFLILIFGLIYHQIFHYRDYKKKEARQNFRRILLPGPRGNIYDRNGELLVGNRPLFSAVVYLNELRPEFRKEYIKLIREARESGAEISRSKLQVQARKNVVQRYMDQVCEITGRKKQVKERDIERHFRQNLLLPLPLIVDLNSEEYAKLLEDLKVDSPIQIMTDSARYYPYEKAACHTLGYVVAADTQDSDELPGDELKTFRFKSRVGRSGLEKSLDEHLRGESGGEIWVVDPSGFQYKRTVMIPPKKGHDLVTSLDIDMQLAAEKAMDGKVSGLVAIDVLTGEVMALASTPGYNLNDLTPYIPFKVYDDITARGAWLNRAVQGLYKPGSTFKIVTSIAGLKAGVINDGTIIDCLGYLYVGRRRFHCHRRSGHGRESLEEAIRDSCNVFFYKVGLDMGIDQIYDQAKLFGLTEPTGIELKNETHRMMVSNPKWKKHRLNQNWYLGDTANASIGEGFTLITPLQMACFTASLARQQIRTKPTLIHKPFKRQHTPSIKLKPDQYKRVIAGMALAASEGTARLVRLPGIDFAGKTGTAQVQMKGKELTLAWFIGFAPLQNPRLAIAVVVEETKMSDNFHGGSTAAPIAREVFKKYFEKY